MKWGKFTVLLHISFPDLSHLWLWCCVRLFSDAFSSAGMANASSQGFFPKMWGGKGERGFSSDSKPLWIYSGYIYKPIFHKPDSTVLCRASNTTKSTTSAFTSSRDPLPSRAWHTSDLCWPCRTDPMYSTKTFISSPASHTCTIPQLDINTQPWRTQKHRIFCLNAEPMLQFLPSAKPHL